MNVHLTGIVFQIEIPELEAQLDEIDQRLTNIENELHDLNDTLGHAPQVHFTLGPISEQE